MRSGTHDRPARRQQVALIFLGPSDGSARADVERTLADSDAGALARVVAPQCPVDGADLDATLEGDELLAGYAGADGDYSELGRELGASSPRAARRRSGTRSRRTWSRSARTGVAGHRLGRRRPDGLPPDDANGDEEADAEVAGDELVMEGLVRGLDDAGIPVVGAAAMRRPRDHRVLPRPGDLERRRRGRACRAPGPRAPARRRRARPLRRGRGGRRDRPAVRAGHGRG